MADKIPALNILNTFEKYLNTLILVPSQKENILSRYNELKNIICKQPFQKQDVNTFFTSYRNEKTNLIIFDENESFTKPTNFIEKIITFLIDIDKFGLYDSEKLKKKYNFVIQYKSIRSFNNDPNYDSFYQCIVFAHIEFLIKTRNLFFEK